jgi:hypothetical protein
VGGVGDMSMGKGVVGRSEGRVGGENESERKNQSEERRMFCGYLMVYSLATKT